MADEFKPFSVREMDTNHMYALIFGCSGSGKSFLVKRLLYDMYKDKNSYWDEFFLISPTEDLSHSFGMFNKANVKDKFDEDWINEKILEPRIRMMKGKKRMSNGKKKGQQQLPNALIIIDDCASDPGIRHSEILNKLFISFLNEINFDSKLHYLLLGLNLTLFVYLLKPFVLFLQLQVIHFYVF